MDPQLLQLQVSLPRRIPIYSHRHSQSQNVYSRTFKQALLASRISPYDANGNTGPFFIRAGHRPAVGKLHRPKSATQVDGSRGDIDGWILGRRSPAVAIEVVHQDAVLRHSVMNSRSELTTGYPRIPGAERGGFRTSVSPIGMTEAELHLQAVLQDQRRVPIGTIRKRRARWHKDGSERQAIIQLQQQEASLRSDPWYWSVTASHFAEHLDVLQQYFRPSNRLCIDEGVMLGGVIDTRHTETNRASEIAVKR